jgi:hypothetical protein
MKTVLVVVSFFGLLAQAQMLDASNLMSHRVNNCNFWSYQTGGTGGYICSGYPQSIVVPDAYSTADIMTKLEERILKLEAKVQLLSEKGL